MPLTGQAKTDYMRAYMWLKRHGWTPRNVRMYHGQSSRAEALMDMYCRRSRVKV